MARGLSQPGLAEIVGLVFQQIQKYESGVNDIASSRIPGFCRALDCDPNTLFNWDASMDAVVGLSPTALRIASRIDSLAPGVVEKIEALLNEAAPAKEGA